MTPTVELLRRMPFSSKRVPDHEEAVGQTNLVCFMGALSSARTHNRIAAAPGRLRHLALKSPPPRG
jgi:hypothetical protein